MKVTLRHGASRNPARRLIQQMTKLDLMEGNKKNGHKSKLKRKLKRIINAPHNTNSYLINLYSNNHLNYNQEDDEEWILSSGTMIDLEGIDDFEIDIDVCTTRIV